MQSIALLPDTLYSSLVPLGIIEQQTRQYGSSSSWNNMIFAAFQFGSSLVRRHEYVQEHYLQHNEHLLTLIQ